MFEILIDKNQCSTYYNHEHWFYASERGQKMGERANKFMNLVHSSEMMCSLLYEDVRGCPYNSFTPGNIAVLSLASSFLAVASLVIGWA